MEFVLDDVVTVIGPAGESDPANDPGLSPERLGGLYGQLLAARRLDVALGSLRDQGRVAEYQSTAGEEAVAVGVATAMQQGDWLVPSGRDAAAVLARGVPLELWMAHVLGTVGDPSKARQGADRFSSRAWRVMNVNPHGASQLPQAVGLAWAMRARKEAHAAVCLLDASARDAGEFHNGMNFAGVFRAPVVFVVRARRGDSIARRAFAYGLRAARVDGRDVLAVYRVVRDALDRARRGEGATLVEALIDGEGDPIVRLRDCLEVRGFYDSDIDATWNTQADAAIEKAVEKASRAGAPTRASSFDDVFEAPPWHLVEQRA